MSSQTSWDIGDPEPEDVTRVMDLLADDEDDDSQYWGKTNDNLWKGYKNGFKIYLEWPELVRRWGPVQSAQHD